MKSMMLVLLGVVVLVAVAMAQDDCADSGSDCEGKTTEDCVDADLSEKCQKTCHMCGECGDSRPDCDVLKERGDCEKMDDRVCRKTCGGC